MISLSKPNIPFVINNYLSVQVAASYSGYSIQYLRRLLRSGKLAGIKIGQLWLVEKGDIDSYLDKMIYANDRRFGPK
jgi:excisionase family DNA binding protein